MKDSGYETLVANIRATADMQEAKENTPENVNALRNFSDQIAKGRWGINPQFKDEGES